MDKTGFAFEDEVRKCAIQLWPDMGGGAVIIDNQERDGVYVTEESIHLLECTISNKKDKAEQDCKKLKKLSLKLASKHLDKGVKTWFVTKDEPTADQRSVAQNYDVTACSFTNFRTKLVNIPLYFEVRQKHSFGSVRNPETDSIDDRDNYVKIDTNDDKGNTWSLKKIANELKKFCVFVATGEYGIGKSTMQRELFFELVSLFKHNKTSFFPIHLNLREHHGQTNTAEALERHARNIGFPYPYQLVRAWRAGYVILLLDGFDELGQSSIIGKSQKLKDIRRQAVELVRNFIKESAQETGIIITGRSNFFDTSIEMNNSLGISDLLDCHHLILNDFTEEQIEKYLSRLGKKSPLPSWFPSRPLLLGYLAVKNILADNFCDMDPAEGWDYLLSKISKRESDIECGISEDTVRKIIEYLAIEARCSHDGLGAIDNSQLISSFKQECGYDPDDKGIRFLQRLAPLGASSDDGIRRFVDKDLVDTACARPIIDYIKTPYN